MADSSDEAAAVAAPLLQRRRNWEGDWPKSIKYLIWNEFCERFSFYGFKTILALYLLEHLHLSETASTEIVHLFIVMCYATPLLGAVFSDVLVGPYRTILYLSVIYAFGNCVLALSALPDTDSGSNALALWTTAAGLVLVGFGTGGIKPCVSAFGGDQIELTLPEGPAKEKIQRQFFSLFYFSVNAGAFISTVMTPVLREKCSYAVAFGVPAVLMIIAVFIFWAGYKFYIDRPPEGNIFAQVGHVILDAVKFQSSGSRDHGWGKEDEDDALIGNKVAVAKMPGKRHWLDAAKQTQGTTSVEDVKSLLAVMIILLPTSLFWSLYDQQSSKWVFQARDLNGKVPWWLGGFVIQPDQMQALNPVLILGMIPLFDQVIYPSLEKSGFSLNPIRRMWMGISLSAVAFVISALLQVAMEWNANSESGTQISILWQIPQLTVVTAGEILFSITSMEFAYTEAPDSMKSLVQAFSLFTVSGGNLVTVVIVAVIGDRLSQTNEYLFFAFLATVATLVMVWLGSGFVYRYSMVVDPEDPHHIDSSKAIVEAH